LVFGIFPSTTAAQRYVVGEHAEYEVRYGPIGVGSGTLGVVGIDTLRGRDAYHVRLTLNGRVNLLLYRYTIRDTIESWVDTASFQSLRFVQRQMHQNKPRVKRYEIFPERGTFADGDTPEQPSVSDPLDDISLLYYARSQPLEVGSTIEIPRYFKPASNPVTLKVVRRETVEAAGKKWNTIVVQPIIKTSTMFSDGEGLVWLSDDSARVIVQINTKVSVGSITLKLRSYQPSQVKVGALTFDRPRSAILNRGTARSERRRRTRCPRRRRGRGSGGGTKTRSASCRFAPPRILRVPARLAWACAAPAPRRVEIPFGRAVEQHVLRASARRRTRRSGRSPAASGRDGPHV
jgi:hypothetical protein